jgi:RNA polymerase sigma-70 factor (ECF subfamily)
MADVDTPISLLDRLLDDDNDEAWQQFQVIYEPLIRRWVGRLVSGPADVDDITQDVLKALVEGLRDFRHNRRTGAFRAWLRSITINRVRRRWRKHRPTAVQLSEARDLEDPRSELSRLWDEEHDRYVVQKLLARIRPEFDAATWEIFDRLVFGGCSPREIARDLGCSPNAVYITKSRVIKRLRLEARGLVDENGDGF